VAITTRLDYAAGIVKLLRRPVADKGINHAGRLPLSDAEQLAFRSSERDDALIYIAGVHYIGGIVGAYSCIFSRCSLQRPGFPQRLPLAKKPLVDSASEVLSSMLKSWSISRLSGSAGLCLWVLDFITAAGFIVCATASEPDFLTVC
jgi:hypothetical protein